MPVSLAILLDTIKKTGVTIEIEKRNRKGWYDYGFKYQHAFVHGYINRADNEEWDVMVLGYPPKDVFSYGQQFWTNKVIGIVKVSDGNHKLLMKIPYKRNFSTDLFDRQVSSFLGRYRRKWPRLKVEYEAY